VSEIWGERTSMDPVAQMTHSAQGRPLLWAARLQIA
jgi:hypothetical protein